MGAFVIAVVASSAPAYAHCLRHIYNKSDQSWHFQIINQPSNNVVDRWIPPGGSSSYWIVTDGKKRVVRLTFGRYPHRGYTDGTNCKMYAYRGSTRIIWNSPVDGDIKIRPR
ncbi:MAG: hypothetical protein COB90_04740 [Hyphomicrobiales bacterium]|nr:MAG: hypothetical protein COB90_04740 [Hyphomicrobiales bacterium]